MRSYRDEGWYKIEGVLNDNNGKNLLPYISQTLFIGKHTTTYKYCFLKSILDNLYSFDNNFCIDFKRVGETFVSIYWNMICVFKIPQMASYLTGERSVFERIVEQTIEQKPYLDGVLYESINELDKKDFLKKAIPEFQKNVIGAFYEDTEGMIYGFSKKEKKLWLNENSFKFLTENRLIIEQVNYYQWLKMVDAILKANGKSIQNLSTILECITKRTDLSSFKEDLLSRGEKKVCFYCGKPLSNRYHLDHVIPWDFLKNDEMWNFVFACPSCNSSKNNKIPDDEYIDKLAKRNEALKIASPDIKKIVESARLNGVKKGWKPRG